MTPNDALTHLQRSNAHSRSRKTPPQSNPAATSSPLSSSAPSLRRRLTRSPSPSITLGVPRRASLSASDESMPAARVSGNSSQPTFHTQPHRTHRLSSSHNHTNGQANGIPLVLEEEELANGLTPKTSVTPAQRPKVDFEVPRKLLHSSIGFVALALWVFSTPLRPVVQVAATSLLVVSSAEILRFNNPSFERLYERVLGFLMRDSEKSKINGVIWYFIGVLFSITVYPLDVGVVSVVILSWADTTASTIGRMYGYLTPPLPRTQLYIPLPYLRNLKLGFARRKSMAGFIAASITGFVITTSFWSFIGPLRAEPLTFVGSGWKLAGVGIISGLISGVVEAIDFGRVDDNLTLPVLSGALIWALLHFLR